MRHFGWFAAGWLFLAGLAMAAESGAGQPGAETLPAPAALELFGHQSHPADAKLPESQREVKRPDPAAQPEKKRTEKAAKAEPVPAGNSASDDASKRTSVASATAGAGSTAGGSEGRLVARTAARDVTSWRFRDMLPLGIVLGLIVAIGFVFKRFLPGRKLLAGGGAIEVLARSVISSKQSLILVRLGRRLLLVGVSPEQLNTLCVVEEPEQVAGLLGEIASHQPNSITQAFRNSFADEADQYVETTPEDPAAEVRGQIRGLLDKIRSYTSRHVA